MDESRLNLILAVIQEYVNNQRDKSIVDYTKLFGLSETDTYDIACKKMKKWRASFHQDWKAYIENTLPDCLPYYDEISDIVTEVISSFHLDYKSGSLDSNPDLKQKVIKFYENEKNSYFKQLDDSKNESIDYSNEDTEELEVQFTEREAYAVKDIEKAVFNTFKAHGLVHTVFALCKILNEGNLDSITNGYEDRTKLKEYSRKELINAIVKSVGNKQKEVDRSLLDQVKIEYNQYVTLKPIAVAFIQETFNKKLDILNQASYDTYVKYDDNQLKSALSDLEYSGSYSKFTNGSNNNRVQIKNNFKMNDCRYIMAYALNGLDIFIDRKNIPFTSILDGYVYYVTQLEEEKDYENHERAM